MKCPYCQTENKPNAAFCNRCGKPLQPAPVASPQPVHASMVPEDRRVQIRCGKHYFRVSRPWRDDELIWWVDREGDPPGTPAYLAVEKRQGTGRNTFDNLAKLKHRRLAPVFGKGIDSAGRTYLLLSHVDGERLDTYQPEIEWGRAAAIFQQARELFEYLHKEHWTSVRKTVKPSMFERLSAHLQKIEKWMLTEQEQATATTATDTFKQFQRAFALDGQDNLTLVDYAFLEPLPMLVEERRECLFQDTRLAIGLLYWLCTAKRLTRDLAQLRQSGGQFAQLILGGLKEGGFSLQELGEAVAQLVPRPDPGRTIPLTAPLRRPAKTQPLQLTLRVEALTDVGRQRDHNEDTFLAQRFDDTSGVFLVADGMGGHAAGEVASKMAVAEIYKSALAEMSHLVGKSPDQIRGAIAGWVQNANGQILNAAQARHNNMGTTLTGVLVLDAAAYVVNVGDSRTYLHRLDKLYQLSRDHSLVASLIQAGMLSPEEAYAHPQRNEIFRSLGQQKELRVDVYAPLMLTGGDRLLVCSDGLWEMVREPQLEEIMQKNADPKAACEKLIETANANGGEDNITAVIVQIALKS